MNITKLHGDFLEVAIDVPDNSVDLLLTDPPYNISTDGADPVWIDPATGKNKNTIHSQQFSKNFEKNWDSVGHDEFIEQMTAWSEIWYKKLRKGGSFAVFISDQYISYLWKIMESTGFEPKRVWTWKKPAAVPFNRRVNPVSGCEYILFGIKPGGKRTFNADSAEGTMIERYALADKISSIVYKHVKDSYSLNLDEILKKVKEEANDIIKNRKAEDGLVQCVIPNTITYSGGLGKNKIHPTQKPVEILKYFINLLSKENDMVLDTFAGSGSTGVAAYETNRRCTLIERDTKMFELMSKKIDTLVDFEKFE